MRRVFPLLIAAAAFACATERVDAPPDSLAPATLTPAPQGPLPDAPRLFLLDPGDGSATAQIDPPFPAASGITSYTVSCVANSTTTKSATGPSSPITVPGLTNGLTYACSVRATNANGTGLASNAMSVMPGTPIRPFSPNVTPGNASATVAFQVPMSDGGSAITGYTATCSATGQPTRVASGSYSPITVTGLTNGTTYSCGAFASNAVGPGQMSASLSVTPGVPTAPTSVSAAAGNGKATFSFSAPVSDGGSPITRYTVFCARLGPGGDMSVSGPESPITMLGMTNGAPYSCSLWATNANGNGLTAFVGVTPSG